MSTKEQLEEVAASFLACKAAVIQAKEFLWKARDAVYDAHAKAGISCMHGEMWDIADIASLLTTLSYRLQVCLKETEQKASEAKESPIPKTMKELAKEAIDVQDACNLSGVVISFGKVLDDLRAILRNEEGYGTDMVNTHPICVLYSDKIASLTGSYSGLEFSKAYMWAKEVSGGP